MGALPRLAAQLFNVILSIEAVTVSTGPVPATFASTRLSISNGDRDSHEYFARPERVQPLVMGGLKAVYHSTHNRLVQFSFHV